MNFLGLQTEWYKSDYKGVISKQPDSISNDIYAILPEVKPGSSGAPLIRGNKIIGMIYQGNDLNTVSHKISTLH